MAKWCHFGLYDALCIILIKRIVSVAPIYGQCAETRGVISEIWSVKSTDVSKCQSRDMKVECVTVKLTAGINTWIPL